MKRDLIRLVCMLTTERPSLWGRRELANRLWRPSLFLDDDALLKPGSWVNDPWYIHDITS